MAEERKESQVSKSEESGRRVLTGFAPDMVSHTGSQLVIKNNALSELIASKFAELGKMGPNPAGIDVDVTVRG